MERARLPGVDAQVAEWGWTRTVVAEDLEKEQAEELKKRERAAWEARGYTYQTRPQLS